MKTELLMVSILTAKNSSFGLNSIILIPGATSVYFSYFLGIFPLLPEAGEKPSFYYLSHKVFMRSISLIISSSIINFHVAVLRRWMQLS